MPGARGRVRERFVESGRARIYVRETGYGHPIVVVHGGPDFDHAYLLPDLDRLADEFRLVYYDQRGRGRSTAGVRPAAVTMQTEVDDLDAVRAACGDEVVAVLGHSWGAVLAMAYAIGHPDRLSHLILLNPAPASAADAAVLRRAWSAARTGEQTEAMAALASSRRYRAGDREADAEYYRIHFAHALYRPDRLEDLVARLRVNVTSDGIVLARQIEQRLYEETWSREGYDLTAELSRLRIPTLVIHGRQDPIPLEVARHVAEAIPGSRFVVLDECGHFAYLEQPQLVQTISSGFLAP